MTDTYRLCDLETEVEEEIKWHFEHEDMGIIKDCDQDTLNEISDGAVPIYNWDILAYAQDKLWLASSTPTEMAPHDESTAISLITANIHEHLSQHARTIYDQLLEEQEEE